MGIWRFAGAFAVVERQSECGSKTAGMHVSQPMNIGILWLFQIICIKIFCSLSIVLVFVRKFKFRKQHAQNQAFGY